MPIQLDSSSGPGWAVSPRGPPAQLWIFLIRLPSGMPPWIKGGMGGRWSHAGDNRSCRSYIPRKSLLTDWANLVFSFLQSPPFPTYCPSSFLTISLLRHLHHMQCIVRCFRCSASLFCVISVISRVSPIQNRSHSLFSHFDIFHLAQRYSLTRAYHTYVNEPLLISSLYRCHTHLLKGLISVIYHNLIIDFSVCACLCFSLEFFAFAFLSYCVTVLSQPQIPLSISIHRVLSTFSLSLPPYLFYLPPSLFTRVWTGSIWATQSGQRTGKIINFHFMYPHDWHGCVHLFHVLYTHLTCDSYLNSEEEKSVH